MNELKSTFLCELGPGKRGKREEKGRGREKEGEKGGENFNQSSWGGPRQLGVLGKKEKLTQCVAKAVSM